MLALAASHLNATSSESLSSAALSHRVQAVSKLNASLSRPAATQAEVDARFAAFLALTFQSSYMEDGLMEFMTMIRGCALVSERNTVDRHPDSAFEPFSEQKHLVMMMERINAAHVTEADPALLDEAMASLRALTTLCQTKVHVDYLNVMIDVVNLCYQAPAAGKLLMSCYERALTTRSQPTSPSAICTISPLNFRTWTSTP